MHAIANKFNHDIEKCGPEFSGLFTKVGRVQFLVLALICSGFIVFGKAFIQLWAGNGYRNSYYVCLLLMLPSTILYVQTLGIEIQRSMDKHQFRSIFYFGMAICNLFLSIIFCRMWGEIGSALGTSIALILADGVAMNLFYYKVLKIDVLSFWRSLIKMLLGLLPPVVFGIVYSLLFLKDTWASLGIGVIVYSGIYVVGMYFMIMNEFEKNTVKMIINRFKRMER